MSKKIELLTLDNLGRGIVRERFEEALQQVSENIADVNTSHKTARKITIEVVIKPVDESRNHNTIDVDVKCKLAKEKPTSQIVFIGKDRESGKYVTSLKELDQEEIDFNTGEESTLKDVKLA